jgi:hypothetical protein
MGKIWAFIRKQRPGIYPVYGVVKPRLIFYKSETRDIYNLNAQSKRVALIHTLRCDYFM